MYILAFPGDCKLLSEERPSNTWKRSHQSVEQKAGCPIGVRPICVKNKRDPGAGLPSLAGLEGLHTKPSSSLPAGLLQCDCFQTDLRDCLSHSKHTGPPQGNACPLQESLLTSTFRSCSFQTSCLRSVTGTFASESPGGLTGTIGSLGNSCLISAKPHLLSKAWVPCVISFLTPPPDV